MKIHFLVWMPPQLYSVKMLWSDIKHIAKYFYWTKSYGKILRNMISLVKHQTQQNISIGKKFMARHQTHSKILLRSNIKRIAKQIVIGKNLRNIT